MCVYVFWLITMKPKHRNRLRSTFQYLGSVFSSNVDIYGISTKETCKPWCYHLNFSLTNGLVGVLIFDDQHYNSPTVPNKIKFH